MGKRPFSLRARLQSLQHAWRGIDSIIKEEHNARIHLFFTVLVVGCGIAFVVTITEWLFLVFAIGLVWVTELLNTCIERLCDFIEPNENTSIGKIKDFAAGSVLVAAITSAIIGLIIFVPKLI